MTEEQTNDTQEVKEEQEEKVISVKNGSVDAFLKFKELKEIDPVLFETLIPNLEEERANQIVEDLYNKGLIDEDLKNLDKLSEKEKVAFTTLFYLDNVGYDLKGKLKLFNQLSFNGENVGLQYESVKGKGVVSGEKALLLLQSETGNGKPISNFLPTSGLKLKLKPLSSNDALTFEQIVADAEVEKLADYTSALLSSTSFYIVKALDVLLKRLKIDTNLKQGKVNLSELIYVDDIGFVFAALFAGKYPNGYEGPVYCKNAFEQEEIVNEDGSKTKKDKCDVKGLLTVNPLSMCYTDYERFNASNIEHMALNKVDVADLTKYQLNLDIEFEREVNIPVENGNDLTIVLYKPTIKEYLKFTTFFKEFFINRLEKIYEIYDAEYDKVALKEKVMETNVLFSMLGYIYYVKSISIKTDEGKAIVEDPKTICTFIINSVQTEDILSKIKNSIDDFKRENTIAFFGTPSFVCPKCKELNQGGLENINPLNPMGFFVKALTM